MNPPRRHGARPSIPWGLLGAIALVALVERSIARDPEYAGNVAASWRFKGAQVARPVRGDILCFGDSMLQFGVLPRIIEGRTGRPSYNFGVHGGPAPASYFLLRRALESGGAAALVLADFSRILLEDGPASKVRPYPWAELLTLREAAELARSARDADLFATILLGRLPSFRGRFEVRASVRAALEGRVSYQRLVTLAHRRNWAINAGAQVLSQDPDFRDVRAPSGKPGTRRLDPTNALYLEKFLGLAGRHGIAVVWLLPPISPEALAAAREDGAEASFARLIREAIARHPNVVVFDGRRSGYHSGLFHDPDHLQRQGAIALSDGIADVLRDYPDPTRIPGRRIDLPAPEARSLRAPIEEIDDSLKIAGRTSRRRR